MKTRIHLRLAGFILMAAAGILALPSCSDDIRPDLRDEITGTYQYRIQIFDLVDDELIYLGDRPGLYDVTGTMLVRKNLTYSDMLDFFDGNILMFQGEKVREAGNAIVFDIPVQEGWVGPLPIQVAGYDYWQVNSKDYHGAYLYRDETVEIGFSAYVMDVNSGLVMVLTARRN